MQPQWLSFNESQPGGGKFVIPGYPEEDSEEVKAMLREPMPLKRSWVLWEQVATATRDYATRKVVVFGTAQEFWEIWNGVPQPSELLDGKRFMREAAIDAIMIFQEGISPEWEDVANANGGHFQIHLKPPTGGGQIDEYWNNLVLAVIGETMDGGTHITGVRLVDKLSMKGKVTDIIRLELWYHSKATNIDVAVLKKSMEKCLLARLDGSQAKEFKPEAIQDKKHTQQLSK